MIAFTVTLIVAAITYGLVAARRADAQAASPERAQPSSRRGTAPTIGAYRLDMMARATSRFVELSQAEKQALNLVVEFKNERVFHAPPADYGGFKWDVVLGAVDDRVYKISSVLFLQTRATRDAAWRKIEGLLRAPLGSPASSTPAVLIWDTEDGNVVLNRADAGDAYALVLTLTSSAVKGFARVK